MLHPTYSEGHMEDKQPSREHEEDEGKSERSKTNIITYVLSAKVNLPPAISSINFNGASLISADCNSFATPSSTLSLVHSLLVFFLVAFVFTMFGSSSVKTKQVSVVLKKAGKGYPR